MTTHNIEKYKTKLEEEKARLEQSLRQVGRINPENPEDWEATPADLNVTTADKNEFADTIEDYEERAAIEVELENRLNNIKHALEQIENNSYGICEVCGEDIEEDRLEANPAATTCKKHLNN